MDSAKEGYTQERWVNGQLVAVEKIPTPDTIRTNNQWSGFLCKCLLTESEATGYEPGEIIKSIVYQHYKNKAA